MVTDPAPTATRPASEFWKIADSKLIRYGGKWSGCRVVRAKGCTMWVSAGRGTEMTRELSKAVNPS